MQNLRVERCLLDVSVRNALRGLYHPSRDESQFHLIKLQIAALNNLMIINKTKYLLFLKTSSRSVGLLRRLLFWTVEPTAGGRTW